MRTIEQSRISGTNFVEVADHKSSVESLLEISTNENYSNEIRIKSSLALGTLCRKTQSQECKNTLNQLVKNDRSENLIVARIATRMSFPGDYDRNINRRSDQIMIAKSSTRKKKKSDATQKHDKTFIVRVVSWLGF